MNRKVQREIASKGGRAAQASGRAHNWTSDEARAAGRKGGLARHANRLKLLAEQQATTQEVNA